MVLNGFVPNRTQLAVMQLHHGYFCRTNKKWAIIDQTWMLCKLRDWYGIQIKRRCLAKNLAILREEGMIDSKQRHWNRPASAPGDGSPLPGNGHFEPRPSMYRITKKLKQFFHKLANYFKRCNWNPEIPGLPVRVGKAAARQQEVARAVQIDRINEEAERRTEVRKMEVMDPTEARTKLFAMKDRL